MLAEAQHRIRHPVEAGDALLVEQHLFLERAARRLDHLTHDLRFDRGWIDDLAGVECAEQAFGDDHAGPFVHLDLGDRRAIGDMMGADANPAPGHYLAAAECRA